MQNLTREDAMAAVALTSVWTDGYLDPEEDGALVEALLDTQAWPDERTLRTTLVRLDSLARQHGDAALRAAACQRLRGADALATLQLAASLVTSDATLETAERDYLSKLGQELGLTEQTVMQALEGNA